MAMVNPKGRVNYEPNSWGGAEGGPREVARDRFPFLSRGRNRAEGSRAVGEFRRSLQPGPSVLHQPDDGGAGSHRRRADLRIEQGGTACIRERLVSHLPNIDAKLADRVAHGLGLKGKVTAAAPAVAPREDLKKAPSLSIMLNGPESFAGRKVGVLVTDGVDSKLIDALRSALETEGATLEVVAPTVGGVKISDGTQLKADHKLGGAPSVLFDAVAVLLTAEGVSSFAKNAAASEFVADAFGHLKFIAWNKAAMPLLEKAGISGSLDEGCIEVTGPGSITKFVKACRGLRRWEREQEVTF